MVVVKCVVEDSLRLTEEAVILVVKILEDFVDVVVVNAVTDC